MTKQSDVAHPTTERRDCPCVERDEIATRDASRCLKIGPSCWAESGASADLFAQNSLAAAHHPSIECLFPFRGRDKQQPPSHGHNQSSFRDDKLMSWSCASAARSLTHSPTHSLTMVLVALVSGRPAQATHTHTYGGGAGARALVRGMQNT